MLKEDGLMPSPGAGFEWKATRVAPVLTCGALDIVAPHLFTTQRFLLGSTRTGDEPWREIADTVGCPDLIRVNQVHGRALFVADDDAPRERPDADIIVSSRAGRAIAVQGADCIPLLVADRRLRVVAAAHAGWRGLAQRVPMEAVCALSAAYGSRPADLVVAIGPSIGACCYEIGPDVITAFEQSGATRMEMARWFVASRADVPRNTPMPGVARTPRPGHAFFDGWQCAFDQLVNAGVPHGQIHRAELCTASHPEVLCSYRRDGASAGRIAGVIVVPRDC